jgi:hypothetical protein
MLITRLVILNIDKQPVAASNIPASAGASNQGWMGGGLMDTPLGLFTFLSVSYGYKNRQVAIASVRDPSVARVNCIVRYKNSACAQLCMG